MQITDIKEQRKAGRISVYIDNKFAFGLTKDELINLKLHLGDEVTKSRLTELYKYLVIGKALNRCLRLLSYRSRSEWELAEYLKRNSYEETITNNVLNRLKQLGYVNDEEFARQWLKNRVELNRYSLRRIKQELRHKRVDESIITKVLNSEEIDEITLLNQLIIKKRRQSRYQDDLKLKQYLSRNGFTYDQIIRALGRDDS